MPLAKAPTNKCFISLIQRCTYHHPIFATSFFFLSIIIIIITIIMVFFTARLYDMLYTVLPFFPSCLRRFFYGSRFDSILRFFTQTRYLHAYSWKRDAGHSDAWTVIYYRLPRCALILVVLFFFRLLGLWWLELDCGWFICFCEWSSCLQCNFLERPLLKILFVLMKIQCFQNHILSNNEIYLTEKMKIKKTRLKEFQFHPNLQLKAFLLLNCSGKFKSPEIYSDIKRGNAMPWF